MKNTFEDLEISCVGDFQGVLNQERQFVVSPIYDEVIIWSYGIEVVKDGKHGGYNFDGKLIVPIEYATINFNEEYFVLVSNFEDLQGAYNYDGKLVIPVQYNIVDVGGKFAIVEDVDGKCGVYNEKDLVLTCKYMSIEVRREFIIAELWDAFEVYTLTGTKIISVECEFVDVRGGSIFAFFENDDISIYNKEGKLLYSFDDISCARYNKDYFAIKRSEGWYVYDKEGSCFSEEGYEDVHFAKEFVNVKENGHWKVLCECEC